MVTLISEHTPSARKRHYCEECGRTIHKGLKYLSQRCKDGGDVWTFKSHIDCANLGRDYRDKHNSWRGFGDFLPMYETIEPHEFHEWRGHYPHAICRLEFSHQTRGTQGGQDRWIS